MARRDGGWGREIRDTLAPVVFGLAVAIGLRTLVIETFQVHGTSMLPTLQDGQRLLVGKVGVRFGPPAPGAIIVFQPPQGTSCPSPDIHPGGPAFVKRVIAKAGHTVQMRAGALYLDGRALAEPYLPQAWRDPVTENFPPVAVPAGDVWVMGDHRAVSVDSRCFGPLPVRNVAGVAMLVWRPPDAARLLRRPVA